MRPVYSEDSGGFEPRLVLPLSLTMDHRALNGADGARVLSWIADALSRPAVLAVEG